MPTANAVTCNSETSGGMVACLNLVCLPGVVISYAVDETFTSSTAFVESVRGLYVRDSCLKSDSANVSSGSTDSSVLVMGMKYGGESGGYSCLPRATCGEPDSVNISPLITLIVGLLNQLVQEAVEDRQA